MFWWIIIIIILCKHVFFVLKRHRIRNIINKKKTVFFLLFISILHDYWPINWQNKLRANNFFFVSLVKLCKIYRTLSTDFHSYIYVCVYYNVLYSVYIVHGSAFTMLALVSIWIIRIVQSVSIKFATRLLRVHKIILIIVLHLLLYNFVW